MSITIKENREYFQISINENTSWVDFNRINKICIQFTQKIVTTYLSGEFTISKDNNDRLEAFLNEITDNDIDVVMKQTDYYNDTDNKLYDENTDPKIKDFLIEYDYQKLFIINKYLKNNNFCYACNTRSNDTNEHDCDKDNYWVKIANQTIKQKDIGQSKQIIFLNKLIANEHDKLTVKIESLEKQIEKNNYLIKELKKFRNISNDYAEVYNEYGNE